MSIRSLMKLAAPFAALAAALVLAGPNAIAQSKAGANPTVTGPILARAPLGDPSHDYPWMTGLHNLAAVGYVEEEYFYEGAASRFDTAAGQPASVAGTGQRYKTRMIIRRPISARKFNGVVLAEWENVTAGYDLDAMWGGGFEHIVRGGYTWVGISAQRVGVHGQAPNPATPGSQNNGLKVWSPARYGSLDIVNDD